VLEIEFDVFPEGARLPAVEIVQLAENAEFAVFSNELRDVRDKPLVVVFRQFATQRDHQNLAIRFFSQFNGHVQPLRM
jgi:hypothetical protein